MPVHWPRARRSQQRAIYQEIHDQLNGACTMAVNLLVDAGVTAEGLDMALEAGRLHPLLEWAGAARRHATDTASPSQVKAVIARHQDALRAGPRESGAARAAG